MFVQPLVSIAKPSRTEVQYISKQWKGAEEMTSLNLQKMMNLPRKHQEETLQEEYLHMVNMVEEPSESHVSIISDVKGVSLSQAKMKVDKVREPAEPHEIIRSAMGELKDVLRWDEKVQGRNKNNYNVNEAVSQPVNTTIVVT